MQRICLSLLLASATVAGMFSNAHAENETLEWKFEVFLDKKPIGFHDYVVSADGDQRTVKTNASFDVKFLFINAFSYRHENTETWNNQCLSAMNAYTDANGKQTSVNGSAASDTFVVSDGDTQATLPECVMSFAYWNPAFLNATQLLNAQTGEFESVAFAQPQSDSVDVQGVAIEAVRHELTVKGKTIKVWYSADDMRWLALEAPAKGKRKLRYQALTLPPSDIHGQLVASLVRDDR
ncbi:MAG: DUF6134 family protein [Pseudomonadota bacterium]